MPKRLREQDLASVVDFVRQSADGARRGEIAEALKEIPQRTLQRWLKSLVEDGRLMQEGKGPAARYRLPADSRGAERNACTDRAGTRRGKAGRGSDASLRRKRKDTRRICGSRPGQEKPLATTVSFSTAIDPTRLSISRRKSGRTWRKWARRRPGSKRPEPMRSRFSTACSSTCPGTQADSRAIHTRCLIPAA